MDEQKITETLLNEISIITGRDSHELHTEESLASNGINSMGFIELLLAVQRLWKVDLIATGISAADVESVRALSGKILDSIKTKKG